MNLYRYDVFGLGINGPRETATLYTYFEAENDSDAIKRAAALSSAFAVAHGVKVSACVGVTPVRTVHECSACAPGKVW